jgi:hypothetical protein
MKSPAPQSRLPKFQSDDEVGEAATRSGPAANLTAGVRPDDEDVAIAAAAST